MRRHRQGRRARSRGGACAASATMRAAGRRRSGRSSARAATPSRCSIPRGRRRTASSAARRSSSRTRRRSPHSARRACCRSWSASRGARSHPPVVRQAVACAECAQAARAHGHREGHLPAVLDVRRAGGRAVDARKRGTTTTRRRRTSRTARRARARCGTCAGSPRPDGCRTSSTTISCARRSACIPACCGGSSRFRRRTLKPYDAGYVAGWVVERYQIDLVGARAARARSDGCARCAQLCAQQVPGDTYRNLVVHTSYSRQTFKHILAPVWLMSYTYGARAFQCVQNGVTGAIEGEYPKSPWKIARDRARAVHHRRHRDVGGRALRPSRPAGIARRVVDAPRARRRWHALRASSSRDP